jgi:hypothetical protein
MTDHCNGCQPHKERKNPSAVPYAVYESTCARHCINVKRLIVALIVSVALMFASNLAWLIATTAASNGAEIAQHEFDNSR